jgi:hypothetical protein
LFVSGLHRSKEEEEIVNKYLMMMSAAAAVLAGTGGASGQLLSNGCGLGTIQNEKGVYSVQYSNCLHSGIDFGQGLVRKTPQGKFLDLSDSYFVASGIVMSFDLSFPLKNGGTWALWVGMNGTTSFISDSGTYTMGGTPKKGGGKSMAKTMALIARQKAAKAQR